MNHEERLELSKLVRWNIVGDESDPYVPEKIRGKHKHFRAAKDRKGFSKKDLNIIRKTYPRLQEVLDRSPWKFRLHFFVQPKALDPSKGRIGRRGDKNFYFGGGQGGLDLAVVRQAFADYGEPFPAKWKDSINVILTGSFFNEDPAYRNMPPSPWIVIHNMAHALVKSYEFAYHYALLGLMKNAYDGGQILTTSDLENNKKLIETVFNFRSARMGRLRNFNEGLHEIFTSFVHNGGKLGRLNTPPDTIVQGRYKENELSLSDNTGKVEKALKRFRKDIERGSRRALRKAKGGWYYL